VVNFLKSNAELDQLVNLKDRGATFGSLTEDERRALGRTVADLDLTLPPEQLKEQFQRVKSFYDLDYQRKQEDYQRMYNPSYEIKAFSSDVEQQGGNKLSEQEAQELQALRKRFGL
jgi:hypothetical protein